MLLLLTFLDYQSWDKAVDYFDLRVQHCDPEGLTILIVVREI